MRNAHYVALITLTLIVLILPVEQTVQTVHTTENDQVMFLPVVFHDFDPESVPSAPIPADGAEDQYVNSSLNWVVGDPDGDVTYDVYLEPDDTTPDVLVSNDQSATTYHPGILNANTHYYWQVITNDGNREMTVGPVWDFTTGTETSGGTTKPVSLDADSFSPSISSDGRYIAYAYNHFSSAYPDDDVTVVFIYDQQTTETTQVSVASDGTLANSHSGRPSISSDGRYIAFSSNASNLVSDDTNDIKDIFVHDRETGETTRVSVASDGTEGDHPFGMSEPSISGDGRYVAFVSSDSSLVSGDTNGTYDVFFHDRQTGETTRASVASDGTQGHGPIGSHRPSISNDGRYVAFRSYSSNFVSGDTNGTADVFVHDRVMKETTRVSVASDGTQGNEWSDEPSISSDGRYIAFESYSSNLVSNDTNGKVDVFVHDRQTGETTRVSVSSDGTQGNDTSRGEPSISADGRYIAFYSDASSLVSDDTNGEYDVFVHDRQTGETTRVSYSTNGTQRDRIWAFRPSISDDGRYVTYETFDFGGTEYQQVFVYDRFNAQPNMPSNPAPADGAVNQSIQVDLSWTGGDPDGDLVSYDVYFEQGDSSPDDVICNDITVEQCDPGELAIDAEYYWQVIATDAINGGVTTAPVWEFTTGNEPPDMPSNPTPVDGAVKQSPEVVLGWTGGDPEGDVVTYDVYFEADDTTPDVLVSDGQSATTYDPGTLDFDTHYYWQVIATDEHGEMTTGPVWDFITTHSSTVPNVPTDPTPADGALNQSTAIDLGWMGGDPDGDAVTYDVYFETGDATPDELICDDVTVEQCDPGMLTLSTHYYWQVIATDEHGEMTRGTVWEFTTGVVPQGGTTTRVSLASDGTQGNSYSFGPAISSDGRYVAFVSIANNLVGDDTNSSEDVFVHDRQTGETTRVSLASDGTQGNGDSFEPTISSNGRYVAFESIADNLLSDNTNGVVDIFVHDQQTGLTTRVSLASDGTQGNSYSFGPTISSDGRYVAFGSFASNLVSDDTNDNADIFVHDRQTGETARVSLASDGTQGNRSSNSPSISSDGRYVAFESEASNLVSDDTNDALDVFVHDRQTGETARVSLASDGMQGNSSSYYPSISGDGRYVAFSSGASNLVSDNTNGVVDIFVHDRQTGETTRVSLASDGTQGNRGSHYPSISGDGRFVAFSSTASNLVSNDSNSAWDIFVHDRQTGVTARVSLASDGTQGNSGSGSPSMSSDGCYVAFGSEASNLVSDDTNGVSDVFVYDRGNATPSLPSNPSPADGALNQSITADLGWTGGDPDGDSVTYDVYFETRDSTPDELICDDVAVEQCDPGMLTLSTHYYWQVIATDEYGETTIGPVWEFTTGAGPSTTRVSLATDGTQGNSHSFASSISSDGRYVAFDSDASNLVSDDTNGYQDVFVHDRQTGETTRVSLASGGTQGNNDSTDPSISGDGRYVAFDSDASNLVSDDTNGERDVFVHDRQTGVTMRVSLASDGTQGIYSSGSPSISSDGRYVAFQSSANNLVSDDTNGTPDVFVHDRQTGWTTRVSLASDSTQGNSGSHGSSISSDGRYVAFWSGASNLVSDDTNDDWDVFVHDRQTGETTRVSLASDGTQGDGRSYEPSISDDGRYVAFESDASNLVNDDTNGMRDIFIHDRQTVETTRVSLAMDGTQGNNNSFDSSISGDGRYVAFESDANNLVNDDTNGKHDIFVHNQQTGETTRVSVASDGTQGNLASWLPSISSNGRYVAFFSYASNLVSDDTNGYIDIFVRDRGSAPPSLPSNPSPVDGVLDQRVTVDLSWTGRDPDGDMVTYDVYLALSHLFQLH